MIDGLKIQMTTEELECRLAERILWHEQVADEYQEEWRRPESEREDQLMPEHMIEHEMREHREQAATLRMLREHLVPAEIYRLTEFDLRFADLVADFHMEHVAPRRKTGAGGPGAVSFLEP